MSSKSHGDQRSAKPGRRRYPGSVPRSVPAKPGSKPRLIIRSGLAVAGFTAMAFPTSRAGSNAPSVPAATGAAATATTSTSTAPNGGCLSAATVASWPLARQAGQVLMFGVPVTRAAQGRDLVVRYNLAGIIVRGTPKTTDAGALTAIRDAKSGIPAIIAVDEEGGRVQHLRRAVGILPSARKQGALEPTKLRALIAKHARAMRALGFTMNFGPVVDLTPPVPTKNGVGDRSYGADPNQVIVSAGAFVDGMLDGGVYPVLKHFPGHGNATGDTHNVGAQTPPWKVLQTADAIPFRNLTSSRVGRVGVMTAHLHVPGLDDRPVSISKPSITGVLRDQWRFDGLVVTDSLSMWSIASKFTPPNAAVEALKAGNDLLLYDDEPDVAAIVNGIVRAAADREIAARLVQANLRVLRAAGANVCAGSFLSLTPASTTTAPSTTPTTTTTSP
jgi:beta-N-acetylhexosaminidase